MASMGSSPFWNSVEQLDTESGWEIQVVGNWLGDIPMRDGMVMKNKLLLRPDKVIDTMEDWETGSSNGLQPKQADLSCVHALNEPHLHEFHVVPSKHEADQR
ncbi:hypothetical protein Tco_0408782 [Tanacetum coccineum]